MTVASRACTVLDVTQEPDLLGAPFDMTLHQKSSRAASYAASPAMHPHPQ
jgi:hypothetical protein